MNRVERLESPSNQTKNDLKTLSYRQKEVNDYNLMNEKNLKMRQKGSRKEPLIFTCNSWFRTVKLQVLGNIFCTVLHIEVAGWTLCKYEEINFNF